MSENLNVNFTSNSSSNLSENLDENSQRNSNLNSTNLSLNSALNSLLNSQNLASNANEFATPNLNQNSTQNSNSHKENTQISNSTQTPNLNQNSTQNLDQTSHFLAKSVPSSNFTNNTEPNTLKNKFSDILHDKGVVNLSFLVGYFRASGFKHLLEILGHDLVRFKSIRILVGINVDEMLGQMLSNGNDIAFADDKIFHKIFKKSQRKLIAAAPYSKEVEDSVNALKIALESKSLQIRIIKDKNVHAKFYVFSHEPTPQKTQPGAYRFNGSLIVGSSNLSHNGWVQNYEYNLATQDSDDIQNALFEFNALWSQSVNFSHDKSL